MEGLLARIASNDATLVEVKLGLKNLQNAGTSVLCDALLHNTVLHTLHLYHNEITDGSPIAALLRSNHTLTTLNLGFNPLGPEGIAPVSLALQLNDSLRYLDLYGTNVQDEGAIILSGVLAQNNSLEVINLGWNSIGDSGVCKISEALMRNSSLKNLYLDGNKSADVGATALANMLKLNRSLTSLSVYANSIKGVGWSSLLDALEINRVITELYCDFPYEMQQRVNALCKRNKEETKVRKERCQDALVTCLGIRKLHRFDSGLWQDQPREILKVIAGLVWACRNQDEEKSKRKK